MSKPEISSDFTLEDIREIRNHMASQLEKMTYEEGFKFLKEKFEKDREELEKDFPNLYKRTI